MSENIFQPYSVRKAIDAGLPQQMSTDEIPQNVRIKIRYQLLDLAAQIGKAVQRRKGYREPPENLILSHICMYMRRMIGVDYLPTKHSGPFAIPPDENERRRDELFGFIATCEIENFLDILEVFFQVGMNTVQSEHIQQETLDSTYSQINSILRFHGIGFQVESGSVIEVSNMMTHEEIVRPALHLLHDTVFSGANEEFLKALEHYRHGRFGECLNECLKSFESTMKIICKSRNWTFAENRGAKSLIETCIKKGLLHGFTEAQLTQMRVLLETGIPTTRNKLSGHGQGTEQRTVDGYYAQFGINATASAIVLLVTAHRHTPADTSPTPE